MVRATAYLRTLRTCGAPRESTSLELFPPRHRGHPMASRGPSTPSPRPSSAGYELVNPPAPSARRLRASRAGQSRAARGVAIADGLATAQTRPGRPGGSVRLGLAPPRHPFVGCRRSVKRAASLPKRRCAPHRESPRRAARPDGSSTGRQLRTRHKNSDTHGQLHGQPWPTTACASTRG